MRGTYKSAVATRDLAELEDTYSHCPKKHKLPHSIEGLGSCTPLRCAKDNARSQELEESKKALAEADEASEATDREAARAEAKVARVQMQRSVAREIARRRLIPMPEGLQGGDAESYVERRLVELSVDAVAELEYQLKYGSDDQRIRAAERILDSTGHGKKDRQGSSANLIIVQGIMAGSVVPWAKTPVGALPVVAVPEVQVK